MGDLRVKKASIRLKIDKMLYKIYWFNIFQGLSNIFFLNVK